MIGNRRIEELVGQIRGGLARIDLDKVRVRSPEAVEEHVDCPFYIDIKDRRFVCHWRVPHGSVASVGGDVMQRLARRGVAGQVSTAKDNFHLLAISDQGVSIEVPDLHPYPSRTLRSDGPTDYSTGFHTINLPAIGDETWNSGEMLAYLEGKNPQKAKPTSDGKSEETTETLFAIIPDVELLIFSDGTKTVTNHPFMGDGSNSITNCLIGEIHGGRFCLEAKEKDMWVYFRRSINQAHAGLPAAKRVFEGLQAAIGFTHGCHPWPFYWQHVRDHVVVERWVRCSQDCSRSALLPIDAPRMYRSTDAQELFRKACHFFSSESENVSYTTRALWLMREAQRDSMPIDLRLLTLCTVLEGLISRLSDDHLAPADFIGDTQVTDDWQFVKNEGKWKLTRRAKWKLLIDRLRLPHLWNDVFLPSHESWVFYRHPLAHGSQERSSAPAQTLFDAYSRISGAIHILMANSMGYAGVMAASVLEDKRVSLGAPASTGRVTPP